MKVSVNIIITFSKIIALLILIAATAMDFANDRQGTVFMFSIPFIVFLITGKQHFDAKKSNNA